MPTSYRPSTRAVHAGERLDPGEFTPVVSPIYPTVAYTYPSMDEVDKVFSGEKPGYVYTRYGNPTVTAFETAIADLEGAPAAMAFSSGMAALHIAMLSVGVQSGSCVLAAFDLYGATYRLISSLFATLGVKAVMVDAADLPSVEAAINQHHPCLLLAETISNPLLKVPNIPALADLAHAAGAKLMIDNTFASPYLLNPFSAGADYVIHSATKYIGGHGDVTAGVVATSLENRAKMNELNKLVGSILGPFEAWLTHRGLKTLPLRMSRHCQNAQDIAEWLASHPKVEKVNYPGLPDHSQHKLALRLFEGKGYGGVLSFELKDADRSRVFRFMESLQLCQSATTLGDIYTLVLHPATSSHRTLTEEERREVGITEGLVRLSVGIEDVEDILTDLDQALTK